MQFARRNVSVAPVVAGPCEQQHGLTSRARERGQSTDEPLGDGGPGAGHERMGRELGGSGSLDLAQRVGKP